MQVRSFLERYPPFDGLPPDGLDRIAHSTQIEYFPAGTTILRQGAEPARSLYVVRRGAVELLDEGRMVDLLEEGELFGHPSLFSGLSPGMEARAHSDALCYLINRTGAEEVFRTTPGLAFLTSSLQRRSVRALELREAERLDPRLASVGRLVRRKLVTCQPAIAVREAAELMAREGVSSLVIVGTASPGILTDRDLRTRVLAAGLGPETPVRDVMTSPVVTVSADATVEEVLLTMLEHGVHHVPVRDASQGMIGMVTDTDIMGLERNDAFAVRSAIERATDRGDLIAQIRRLPDVVCALVRSEIDAVHIGDAVAVTIDAATRRLIELAMRELGDPPGPWAWLALGSEARHEQALATDQDHAFAFDPGSTSAEEADRYFGLLARHVADGLEEGGIPRCRGSVMAENPAWRRTSAGWEAEFRRWMVDPAVEGRAFTSIALDYRRVAGPLDIEPVLDGVIREAPRHSMFQRRLARTATELHPPTGFFRDLVVERKGGHAGTLDLKEGGIKPITNLARAYAVMSGVSGNRTLRRLRDAVHAGTIDEPLGSSLGESFRLLWKVRLEHHVRSVESGTPLDDRVDPASIGPITRSGLKEAFRTIARAQGLLAREARWGIP
jgi:CBS domain-containing protein